MLKKIGNWTIKILFKGVWVLGFLPQILDFFSTYIPQKNLPPFILNILQHGGNWNLTLILVFLGFLTSSFLVYLDLEKETERLKSDLLLIEESRPIINVGFKDDNFELNKSLDFILQPNPKSPDFEELLNIERKRLLSKQFPKIDIEISPELKKFIESIPVPKISYPSEFVNNPNYEEDIEKYLPKYREYLIKKYEIGLKRAFFISPIIINEGRVPSTNLIVEFDMPHEYSKPKVHQSFNRTDEEIDLRLSVIHKPNEPKLQIRENASRDFLTSFAPGRTDIPKFPAYSPADPIFEEKNGIWKITYKIEQLVPSQEENNLNDFWVWAGEIVKSTIWIIHYRVFSSELREPQKGELTLRFYFN